MLTERITIVQLRARERARALLAGGCVVIDTESTGLDGAARLVEVSILAADGSILLDALIRPGVPIPPDATAIHGITDADVANAPTLRDVWPEIAGAIRGRTVAAWNASFDLRLLSQHAAGYGLAPLADPWACAMELYASYIGAARWVKLEYACKAASVPLSGAHRSLADARATLGLMRVMAGM